MYLQAKFYYLQKNAHRMVTLALYHGDLVKPDKCEQCGASCNLLDSHHLDYSHPLEVIWLCRSCHAVLHGYRGEGNRKPKPSPKLQKALDYLRQNEGDLFTAPRELESKFTGISYGTIHKAQMIIRAERDNQ